MRIDIDVWSFIELFVICFLSFIASVAFATFYVKYLKFTMRNDERKDDKRK